MANFNLPWTVIITSVGGVVLDSKKNEICFFGKEGLEAMREAVRIINQEGK